jgi:hypothetical protein
MAPTYLANQDCTDFLNCAVRGILRRLHMFNSGDSIVPPDT